MVGFLKHVIEEKLVGWGRELNIWGGHLNGSLERLSSLGCVIFLLEFLLFLLKASTKPLRRIMKPFEKSLVGVLTAKPF